ncbi:Dopamine D2-like receptor [Strongyloides ratti]|uniref:Dopamine D2-like receptor n=1 Tax=Strongyloides ratti TaxID=34506 RepID=A0A090LQI8_STRRB|nr:Dopamine D2-like receptor [Strongyloides ratti]CEF69831.1 Dopamine D2-like receptor [Strongyloides ratti]
MIQQLDNINIYEFFHDIDNLTFNNINLEIEDDHFQRNWYYLFLTIFPISCIIGNILVILAVLTTRTLQTPTNYLLMSLAFADLLVGIVLMPLNIYLSINQLRWDLGPGYCQLYCILDVAVSTSSIIHLVLISFDRLVAATKPAEYKSIKHKNRIYRLIVLGWLFSIALSLPLNIKHSFDETPINEYNDPVTFNNYINWDMMKDNQKMFIKDKNNPFMADNHCGIFNPIYMLCSSIFAFYLPSFIMMLTYGYIFYNLRKRLAAVKLHEMVGGQFIGFGADVSNITQTALGNVLGTHPKKRVLISWEKPLLKNIEETAAEHASSLNDSEREQLQTILEAADDMSEDDGMSITISESEYDRPPSIILEAVTLRAPSESGSSSLSVPSIKAKKKISQINKNNKILKSKRMSLAPTSCGGATVKNIIEKRRHSEVTKQDSINSTNSSGKDNENKLKPPNEDRRKLRRLSEIISDWDRNSRPSLSQMYGFARRESLYIARKKLAGLKDWALDLLGKMKNKQGRALRREARATKLVATVMIVFLVCWTPFFTLNMYKVYKLWKKDWNLDMEYFFHWCTGLGYLNSSLNFFIYSVINQRFRSNFKRLIGLKRRSKKSKTWMLPPKKKKKTQNHINSNKNNNQNVENIENNTPDEPRRRSSLLSKLGLSKNKWINKPKIVIDEVSKSSQPKISITGGYTTFNYTSDDCMRRSSSEIIGGVIFPSNYESRRSSGMSNSSASLILHDIHQVLTKSESMDPSEIFV